MRQHPFNIALPLGFLAHNPAGGAGYPLIGTGLEEFADPDSACIAGGTAGWLDVIGSDGFVAIGNCGFFADEQGTVVGQALEVILLLFHLDFQVLGCVVIARLNCLILVVSHLEDAIHIP